MGRLWCDNRAGPQRRSLAKIGTSTRAKQTCAVRQPPRDPRIEPTIILQPYRLFGLLYSGKARLVCWQSELGLITP